MSILFVAAIKICFSAIKPVESAGKDVIIGVNRHRRAEVSHSDILTTYTAFDKDNLMGIFKKATTLSYFTLILLPALAFTLSACRKKESPQAPDAVQNDSVQAVVQTEAPQTAVGGKIPLRILYVGLPDTERQKDFVSFLSENFTEVKTAGLNTFTEDQTKDSDVVILDKDGIQWAGRGGNPLWDLKVSAQYSRPTLSLGIPGAFWADRMRLKTGYM